MKKAKKGQTNVFMALVMGLGIGIVAIAILAIMLQAFKDSQTANSIGANISGDGLTFLDNTTSQFGTAGTILGVSLLLVIIGAIGFGAYAGYQKFRGS